MIPLDEIHPLLIHFPIALFGLVFLFDVLSLFMKDERFEFASFWTLLLAVASSFVAIITGIIADQLEGHMDEPWRIFETHGSMQIVSSLLFVGLMVWRIRQKGTIPKERPLNLIYFGLCAVAVLGIYYGSHLGAMLGGRI